MRHFLKHATMQPGRRSFLLGTAGTLASRCHRREPVGIYS